mgnify:CR=1 FL=1
MRLACAEVHTLDAQHHRRARRLTKTGGPRGSRLAWSAKSPRAGLESKGREGRASRKGEIRRRDPPHPGEELTCACMDPRESDCSGDGGSRAHRPAEPGGSQPTRELVGWSGWRRPHARALQGTRGGGRVASQLLRHRPTGRRDLGDEIVEELRDRQVPASRTVASKASRSRCPHCEARSERGLGRRAALARFRELRQNSPAKFCLSRPREASAIIAVA